MPDVAWTTDEALYLAAEFDVRTLGADRWTHEAHLVVGTYFVLAYGPDVALERLRTGICALNDEHGTPNSSTSGYHETITRFFLEEIARLLAACDVVDLGDAVELVLASHLGDPGAPLGHWRRETLFGPQARFRWVEPDLDPLATPGR